jgi:hypothetical protein
MICHSKYIELNIVDGRAVSVAEAALRLLEIEEFV